MSFDFQEEVFEDVLQDAGERELKQLVVFNDDFNTFDHVINTLIRVCKHSQQQAEQCTWIIHYRGKCSVKHGSERKLKPMRNAICDVGIDARIL